MHKHKIAILTLLIFTSVVTDNAGAQTNWNLVFQDDFNGSSVDTNVWRMYYSPGHIGNGLRRPSAFTETNGMLVVTAQMVDGMLVSGAVAFRTNYIYGKYEFRVRADPEPNGVMSAVVLTWPESDRWPMDGENDMYETGTSRERNKFHTYIHYGTKYNTQEHFQHDVSARDWHTVAMEWTPTDLRMYRDGALVWTMDNTNAIARVPHHLCIQLDAFKQQMTGTAHMYVDWVKIYQTAQSNASVGRLKQASLENAGIATKPLVAGSNLNLANGTSATIYEPGQTHLSGR